MDRIPETAAGLGGRSEALHEGVHGGHVRTVAGAAGARHIPYQPRPNRAGPTNRLRKFFEENPEEELTTSDMRIKFGVDIQHADKIARRLCGMGELVRIKEGNRNVFRRPV